MSKKLGLDIDLFVGMLGIAGLSALFAVLLTMLATNGGTAAQSDFDCSDDASLCQRATWEAEAVEEARETWEAEDLAEIVEGVATIESKVDTVQPAEILVVPRGAQAMARQQRSGIAEMHNFMLTAEAEYDAHPECPVFLSSSRHDHLAVFDGEFEDIASKLDEFDRYPTATR